MLLVICWLVFFALLGLHVPPALRVALQWSFSQLGHWNRNLRVINFILFAALSIFITLTLFFCLSYQVLMCVHWRFYTAWTICNCRFLSILVDSSKRSRCSSVTLSECMWFIPISGFAKNSRLKHSLCENESRIDSLLVHIVYACKNKRIRLFFSSSKNSKIITNISTVVWVIDNH